MTSSSAASREPSGRKLRPGTLTAVGKGTLRRTALAAGMLLACGAGAGQAAAASPPLVFFADSPRIGVLSALLGGPPGSWVEVSERVGARSEPVAALQIPANGVAHLPQLATWRCDRQVRTFVLAEAFPAAAPMTAEYTVRTPDCRSRFGFTVPARVRPGAGARITVADRWQLGAGTARLCVRPPGTAARCRSSGLSPGWTRATHLLHPRRPGRWRIELRIPGPRPVRLVRTLRVSRRALTRRGGGDDRPRVVIAGNSMMQSVDSVLVDRIGDRARTWITSRIGTGVTAPSGNALAAARRRAARLRPDVAVVFYGGNDGYDIPVPGGTPIVCCGEAWIAAYARRAGAVMRAYGRRGRGFVLWVTSPAHRSAHMTALAQAINEASRRAAERLPYVRLVRVERLLTPGFRYRDSMFWRGRTRRVRSDGVHLTVDGARIAASLVISKLERLALISPSRPAP